MSFLDHIWAHVLLHRLGVWWGNMEFLGRRGLIQMAVHWFILEYPEYRGILVRRFRHNVYSRCFKEAAFNLSARSMHLLSPIVIHPSLCRFSAGIPSCFHFPLLFSTSSPYPNQVFPTFAYKWGNRTPIMTTCMPLSIILVVTSSLHTALPAYELVNSFCVKRYCREHICTKANLRKVDNGEWKMFIITCVKVMNPEESFPNQETLVKNDHCAFSESLAAQGRPKGKQIRNSSLIWQGPDLHSGWQLVQMSEKGWKWQEKELCPKTSLADVLQVLSFGPLW